MEELIDHLMWEVEHDQWGRERTVALRDLVWLACSRLIYGHYPDRRQDALDLRKRWYRLEEIVRDRDECDGWVCDLAKGD